ncbi:MAG: DsbA family protein [Candidatus Hydrothermarchaeaceae archaeon]
MGRKKLAKKKKVVERAEEKRKIDPVLLLGGLLLLAVLVSIFRGTSGDGGSQVDEPPMANVPGEYTLFQNMPNTHEPGRVQMIVFFDFFCPHCHNFDTGLLPQLEAKYGSQLVVTPVGFPIFGTKAVNALRAHEIAKDFGKGGEMSLAIFDAYHNKGMDISDTAVLAAIAGDVGLDTEQFKRALDSGAKIEIIRGNVGFGNSYNVRQTPTVLLDGQYVVTKISLENIDEIISGLLA